MRLRINLGVWYNGTSAVANGGIAVKNGDVIDYQVVSGTASGNLTSGWINVAGNGSSRSVTRPFYVTVQ